MGALPSGRSGPPLRPAPPPASCGAVGGTTLVRDASRRDLRTLSDPEIPSTFATLNFQLNPTCGTHARGSLRLQLLFTLPNCRLKSPPKDNKNSGPKQNSGTSGGGMISHVPKVCI